MEGQRHKDIGRTQGEGSPVFFIFIDKTQADYSTGEPSPVLCLL